MNVALKRHEIEAAFLAACYAELDALKPGNVHRFSSGHGMDVTHFENAAAAAARFVADPELKVGTRILRATEASFAATGVNTNLGIVLLTAPLAKAAAEIDAATGLRRRLAVILSLLDVTDAEQAFAAILIANPAGLGSAPQGDVHDAPGMTLIQAMHLAADRDRIANAYVTAYGDIFDFALPVFHDARAVCGTFSLAVTTLHMALMAEFPDSHIGRKFGLETARKVQAEAQALSQSWQPSASSKSLPRLEEFDAALKRRGLNPGTTADFVVATLFAARISGRKQS
jgi:triphosphoribosyl-dephospho-CoA synthase